MNIFQSINNAMAAGTAAALLAGIFKSPTPPREQPLTFWCFALFLLLFRAKIHFDDHEYFKRPDTTTPHFRIGFLMGLVSWLLWSVSAYSLGNLRDAYYFSGVAILVSTVWIVVVAMRSGAYRQQYTWLGTNALYVILLWTLYRRNEPAGDWFTWVVFALLFLVLLYDWIDSDSFPAVDT